MLTLIVALPLIFGALVAGFAAGWYVQLRKGAAIESDLKAIVLELKTDIATWEARFKSTQPPVK